MVVTDPDNAPKDSRVAFTSNFPDVLLEPLNINREQVAWSAIHGEFRIRRRFADDLEVEAILKRFPSGHSDAYILVLGQRKEAVLAIFMAFGVPAKFASPTERPNPLKVLQRFIAVVGLEIEVGDRTGPIILDESVPLQRAPQTLQECIRINGIQKERDSLGVTLFRLHREGEVATVQCAMVFAIDFERYKRVLGGHDPDEEVLFEVTPQLEGRLSPQQLLEPQGRLEFSVAAGDGRRAGILVRVDAPGYDFEIGFRDGNAYMRRNDCEVVFLPIEPATLATGGEAHFIFSWSPTRINIFFCDQAIADKLGAARTEAERESIYGSCVKGVETPVVTFSDAVIRWLKRRAIVPEERYRSKAHLLGTVCEALRDIDKLIERTGKPNPFWNQFPKDHKNGGWHPKHETDCHAVIQLLLSKTELAKHLQVFPEHRAGGGQLDFMVLGVLESGEIAKICIEFKLAHSQNLEHGLLTQLPSYMRSQEAAHGIYGVLWFKGRDFAEPQLNGTPEIMSEKDFLRTALGRAAQRSLPGYSVEVVLIDVSRPVPPSKI